MLTVPAFEKDMLAEEKLLKGDTGEAPVLAAYESEFDTGYVYKNPKDAQFSYRDGQIVDETDETHAPDSHLLGLILAVDAMWFAWSGFYTDTNLYV